MVRRPYRKRVRADGEARTRARILDAASALWAEAGPAATTITAVAARAGVQRLTVYRHFADDAILTQETWAHFESSHPLPDPADWATIGDPAKRMRRALRALYAHYRETGDILDRVLCDAGRTPAFDDAVAAREHWLEGVVATLESGWVPRSKAKAKLLAAALEHAVRFNTWRSLSRSGLEDGDAARAMVRFVRALARRQRHNRKA